MSFKADPFEQAKDEVNNKRMGAQIAHSQLFHSMRSAFSSKGSFASKAAGAAVGVGKLFLASIPVPIVGPIVGAVIDAVDGKIRSVKHQDNLDKATTDAEKAKFLIKELTVENLDRYRWKLSHAYEELNNAIKIFNDSKQNCDDLYHFALVYEQLERRKTKLDDELKTFQKVIDTVENWKKNVDRTDDVKTIKDKILVKRKQYLENLPLEHDKEKQAEYIAEHAKCSQWCCIKKSAEYDPNTNWEKIKQYSGVVANALRPIAVSSVSVHQSDYHK
jgi:hypothetical protein